MQGTGKTYEISGETTEWEDILIKKKIITKEEVLINKGLNPEDFVEKIENQPEELEESFLEKASLEDLDELEEEDGDDRIIQQYRQKRLEELKTSQLRNRFGEVMDISRDVWIREVTDSSKACWVVVHLYQDSVEDCRLMHQMLAEVANKYKYVKFLRIQSTQAVENWPDRNLPTLFAYNDGVLKEQMITLHPLKVKSTRGLAKWLMAKNIIEAGADDDDNDDDEDENEQGRRMKMNVGGVQRSFFDKDDEN